MKRVRLLVPAPAAALVSILAVAGCGSSEPTFPQAQAHRPPLGVPLEIDRLSPLPDPLPEVAATVNGRPISTALVTAAAEKRFAALGGAEDRAVAYRTTMHQYVTRELLYQEAERRGLLPAQEAVDKAVSDQRARHADEAAFEASVAEEGTTVEALGDEMQVRLAVGALTQELSDTAQVTDAEARAHHEDFPKEFPGRYEDVAESVKEHLLPQKRLDLVEELITRLRDEATIETFLSASVDAPPDSEPAASAPADQPTEEPAAPGEDG